MNFSIILLIVLIIGFVGFILCITPKIKNIEYKEVEVTIVDSYYRSSYYNPALRIVNASLYQITVIYENHELIINDEKYYIKYKDKIGKKVKAILKISIFTNGKNGYEIIELK